MAFRAGWYWWQSILTQWLGATSAKPHPFGWRATSDWIRETLSAWV